MNAGEQPAEARSSRPLAEKLDHLFKDAHPAGRGAYSHEEVAQAIRDAGGPTISGVYLWQLRKGLRDNPTMKHLEALSLFFGVPPDYWFDDEVAEQIRVQLSTYAALRDSSIRNMALRTAGLSSDSLDAIRGLIEYARRAEGLPLDAPGAENTLPAGEQR